MSESTARWMITEINTMCPRGPSKTVQSAHTWLGLCAGEAACHPVPDIHAAARQGTQDTMVTMKLLLLNAGLTLLSVATADEGAFAIPGAAYRVVTFPASTEKVRALEVLRVGSGDLGSVTLDWVSV